MLKFQGTFFIIVFFIQLGYAQINTTASDQPFQKYWIIFTDKINSPFSIQNPGAFLSEKSIQRRIKNSIAISQQDLPVNKNYIEQVKSTGVEVIVQSKWLNAVSVKIFTEEQFATLSQLEFVQEIIPVKKAVEKINELQIPYSNTFRYAADAEAIYGFAANQFTMINGDFLHNMGYRGEGISIAVIDGGFAGVDTGSGFKSLWEKDQIKEVYNFPDQNENVYFSSFHGSWVLGIMAADLGGKYVGSAPQAEYYLFRSEVVDSERVSEEDFWLAAAEQADFIGADIINSSLGYTTFDVESENHGYENMDGNSTIVTRAADWAASKGILVCNSAGNEGSSEWHYIGAPADGDSVFSIGAVDPFRNHASFSSFGPTFDGRIKPNIVVQGSEFPIVNPNGSIGTGGGTSFASPLAAGASACLWQAFPNKTNIEIMRAIEKSASLFTNPNDSMGYGIPDFALAYYLLKEIDPDQENESFLILNNPAHTEMTLLFFDFIEEDALVEIFDLNGKRIATYIPPVTDISSNGIRTIGLENIASGMYILSFTQNGKSISQKFIVQ